MTYVADTHAFVWFLTNDPKLGKEAHSILQKADEGKETIIVPTIVLAEMLQICENKDVSLKFRDILSKLASSTNYVSYALDVEVLIKAQDLSEIREMHDRIIVATAIITNCKILTKDSVIKQFNKAETVW